MPLLRSVVMQPRKKIGIDPTRNYLELSPADLIASLNLEPAVMDQDEFPRAEWFLESPTKGFIGKPDSSILLHYCFCLSSLSFSGKFSVTFCLDVDRSELCFRRLVSP